MRRCLILAAVLGVLVIATTGCSTCTAECTGGTGELAFTGELIEVDEAIAVFAGPDGPVEILVQEKIRFLDVGETYQVDASRAFGEPVEWETSIGSTCGCAGGIHHEDGGTIDTAWWTGVNRQYPVGAGVLILLGVPAVTLAAVTVNRVRRGADYDPFVDLPADGSWMEYDGLVDHDEYDYDDESDDESDLE